MIPELHTSKVLDDIKRAKQLFNELPPAHLITHRHLSKQQKNFWNQHRNYWLLVGSKLVYLLQQNFWENQGYIFPEPTLCSLLDPAVKMMVEIKANTLFAEFNLMVAGWELIKKSAIVTNKDFKFMHPRELFSQHCTSLATLQTQNFLTSGEFNDYQNLEYLRDFYRRKNAFYRDRLEEKEEKDLLHEHLESGDWLDFTIYAIWDYRQNKKINKRKLFNAWQGYLTAFKSESAMYCKKNFFKEYNCKFSLVKWCEGRAVYTDTNQSVLWKSS